MVNQGMNDWWFCYNRSILQTPKNLKKLYALQGSRRRVDKNANLFELQKNTLLLAWHLWNIFSIVATPDQQPST